MTRVPVITIDGPAASGKGAAARGVASRLGFAHLDSGALYRAVALASLRLGGLPDSGEALAGLVRGMGGPEWERLLSDPGLRDPEVSARASRVAADPLVREALLARQRAARRLPGLVADGRDMGSVVFPDADLKVYLCAAPEVRARRRALELGGDAKGARIADVLADLLERDRRDSTRDAAPMACPDGARVLDNSGLGIDATVDRVCGWFGGRAGPGPGRAPGHGTKERKEEDRT